MEYWARACQASSTFFKVSMRMDNRKVVQGRGLSQPVAAAAHSNAFTATCPLTPLALPSVFLTRSPVDPQHPRPQQQQQQQQQAMGVHPQLRVVNQFAIPGSPLGSPVSESMRQGGGMFGLEVPLPRFSHQGMGRTIITGGWGVRGGGAGGIGARWWWWWGGGVSGWRVQV